MTKTILEQKYLALTQTVKDNLAEKTRAVLKESRKWWKEKGPEWLRSASEGECKFSLARDSF
jgi:hypothetical protein